MNFLLTFIAILATEKFTQKTAETHQVFFHCASIEVDILRPIKPLYKGTLKSNTTLINNHNFGVRMISTKENNLRKQSPFYKC